MELFIYIQLDLCLYDYYLFHDYIIFQNLKILWIFHI